MQVVLSKRRNAGDECVATGVLADGMAWTLNAQALCPSASEISWVPDPVSAGDDAEFRLVEYNAAFGGGIIEPGASGEIRIRSISNSNFGVVPPLSLQYVTLPAAAAGSYTVIWRHRWTTGPGAIECPEVRVPLVVRGGAPSPVPGLGIVGLILLSTLMLAFAARRHA